MARRYRRLGTAMIESDSRVTFTGRKKTRRLLFSAVTSTLALCLVCAGAVGLALLGETDSPTRNQLVAGCGDNKTINSTDPVPQIPGLQEQQARNASTIVRVGQNMKIPPRGWVIAVATALQESNLVNLANLGSRNDHDSIGLFQQRPSQGWGTVEQLTDPAYQASKFFAKLSRVKDWQNIALTEAAQRVQISAYPDAYAKHEPLASRIVDVLTNGANRAVGSEFEVRCAKTGEISAAGWTVPLSGALVSGFRTASRPRHNGVDIAVSRGTPIKAVAAGVVLTAICNAHVGRQQYSCDRDGAVWVLGCGWYVDILHANDVITRYCHQMKRPFVSAGDHVNAGQVIGVSGSSGNSSGPHLHFEVHLHGVSSGSGATDPVPFMNQVGASLTPDER